MYDPTIGQWLSEDPIGFEAGDENLRRYVENNPTNFIDPNGLEKVRIVDINVHGPGPNMGLHIIDADQYIANQHLVHRSRRILDMLNAHIRGDRELAEALLSVLKLAREPTMMGYPWSFRRFWLTSVGLGPSHEEPPAPGPCQEWMSNRREELREYPEDLHITYVEYAVHNHALYSGHAAFRVDVPDPRGPSFPPFIFYIDNGTIGGTDGVFLEDEVPSNYEPLAGGDPVNFTNER